MKHYLVVPAFLSLYYTTLVNGYAFTETIKRTLLSTEGFVHARLSLFVTLYDALNSCLNAPNLLRQFLSNLFRIA